MRAAVPISSTEHHRAPGPGSVGTKLDLACGWRASPTLLRFRALFRNSHAGREAISFMGDCATGNRLDYFRRAVGSNRG